METCRGTEEWVGQGTTRGAAPSLEYGVTTTPTTNFISPDGEIVDVLAGTVDQGWLERNIEAFL